LKEAKTVSDTSTLNAPPQAEAPPLFYSSIEPLSPAIHRGIKIRPESEFAFATKSNTVPLTILEFTLAARHFPILLLGDDLVPVAALGIRSEQNAFVTDEGVWEMGIYVPAYIRRHPFILLGNGTDERLTLGIDMASVTDKPNARALFKDDGKETEIVTQAIEFCNQFHLAFLQTRDFSAALKKADLVTDTTLEVEPTPGQRVNLGTFKRIDEEKFKNLPDATVLEWHKSGFLHATYFLLQSMNNWDYLLMKSGMWAPIVRTP